MGIAITKTSKETRQRRRDKGDALLLRPLIGPPGPSITPSASLLPTFWSYAASTVRRRLQLHPPSSLLSSSCSLTLLGLLPPTSPSPSTPPPLPRPFSGAPQP